MKDIGGAAARGLVAAVLLSLASGCASIPPKRSEYVPPQKQERRLQFDKYQAGSLPAQALTTLDDKEKKGSIPVLYF